jgi:3-methyladenine DNA glycosylase/8-oxoguanine DNA glycosylase
VAARCRTWIVPPRLSSLPRERSHLEYSSRSIVFVDDGRRLVRAWGSPGRPWPLSVEPDGDRWRIEARGATPNEARRAVRSLFSLDHPIEQFYRHTRSDPVLRGTDRAFRGLRVPQDPSVYESLLHSIVGQQVSVAAATVLKRRLFDRCGGALDFDGVEVPCVPAPSRLLASGVDGLCAAGMSRAKARALSALAGWVRHGRASVGRLAELPLDRAVERLDALPGVGRWTAENALLRGAGRPDVFVAGDLGVRVALDRYGAVPRSASEGAARSWAERWYPGWGSYATLYLWSKLLRDRQNGRAG